MTTTTDSAACPKSTCSPCGGWASGTAASRRCVGRVEQAMVMQAMFAVGDRVIGNPTLATFAVFGSFAMLLLVDFGGPMRDRLRAQASLAVVGGVFVCVGTLASQSTPLAAVAMALVTRSGCCLPGPTSSVLAGATTSLLLAFILPVSVARTTSSIPDRLAARALAAGAALLAMALLCGRPPDRDPLRGPAITTCRALAARLPRGCGRRARRRGLSKWQAPPARRGVSAAVAEDAASVSLATPYRPSRIEHRSADGGAPG